MIATKKGHVIGHMIWHMSSYIIIPPGWLDQPKDTCSCQRGRAIFEPRWSPHTKLIPFLLFLSPSLLPLPLSPSPGIYTTSSDSREYTPMPLFSHFFVLSSFWVEDILYLHGGLFNNLLTTVISSQPNWPGFNWNENKLMHVFLDWHNFNRLLWSVEVKS